jgi:hypothetical protein
VGDHWLAIAGVILGVLAIVMAIPPLFQMFFGRPKLTFEADDFTGPDGRILVINAKNDPVRNRFLRWLGVERESTELLAFFDIQELGTGKILVRAVSGLMQCVPLRTIGPVARSFVGFSVGLTVIGTRQGHAHIVDPRHQQGGIPIAPGHYLARITIIRGQYSYKIDQRFRIETEDHRTIWDTRHVVSTRE